MCAQEKIFKQNYHKNSGKQYKVTNNVKNVQQHGVKAGSFVNKLVLLIQTSKSYPDKQTLLSKLNIYRMSGI